MGSPIPNASPPISLPTQQGHLLRRYPNSKVVRLRERLVWLGTLVPAEYTATYELVIDHQTGKSPLVYVARPRLQLVDGQALPHVYPLNTLCLFLGNREWHESIPIADTLVPWAAEWLLFYELWLATGGEWLGEGEHPPPGPVNRRTRRHSRRQDASRLTRLTSALKLVYGAHADLDELLFNTKLGPNLPSPDRPAHVHHRASTPEAERVRVAGEPPHVRHPQAVRLQQGPESLEASS
jgi:hypothetical protein